MANKNRFRQPLIIIILGLFSFILNGQSREGEALKPYVSKIKATPENSQIVITWENPEKTEMPLIIYKYTEKITAEKIAQAEKIATLDSSKESFIYYPPDTAGYFFAVVYAQPSGEPDNVFIDARNVTTKAVKVASVGNEEEQAAKITGIKARAEADSIIVSFNSTQPERALILYRNTSPILTTDDLLKAVFYITLDKQLTTYKDYPIPEIEYYYAVLDAGMVKIGKINLLKNENTTTVPVSIKSAGGAVEGIRKSNRSMPLPLLSLASGADLGSELSNAPVIFLPKEKEISEATRKSITELLTTIKIKEEWKNEVEILPVDTAENKTGEAYSLQQILNSTLLNAKYDEAEEAIFNFLRINHAADIEARAHYYLGQVYFFKKLYRQSFLEFLEASDQYYAETQPWMNSCYRYLEQY